MRINSFGVACTPVPDPAPRFYRSVLVDEERNYFASDGKSKTTEVVKVSRMQVIPDFEFENRGVTCDLFDVSVQVQAGVQLHEITAPFYGVTLSEREGFENAVNSGLDAIEAQLISTDDSIKFD